ncbi:hypothetical protein IQ273_15720 [Nodosilinea sp. LEGE 07298]|uniref:hypothetical protein n=1 Tax=Nodosilinea sp. LEGE 07298 TaxID=2777970 RepID=UPI00187F8A42|nr:hypothetical protein [Nodosilinea sp. LEGE 07298]MBE9110861.1 hypothetical protein [Nodosilinea sp. LEGE 07298]
MTRCLNPVQYRPHHTWLRASGISFGTVFGTISLAFLGLLGGCAGATGGTSAIAPDAASSTEAAIATPFQSIELAPSSADALVSANRIVQAKARRLVVPTDPVAVDLYTLDDRCENYQREPILVPRPQSMETAVALIMAEQAIPELTLSGYRTRFDPETKTVTIDLRVARTSRRVLQSLSVCEQKALLGSLRETLINQPDWKIEAVTFTNRGNPLVP